MNFLASIAAFLASHFAFVFSAVSGVFNALLSEIEDDEIAIMHGAMNEFTTKMQGGSSWEDAATATWNYVSTQEKGELSKVANLLLQAFMAKAAPTA